jgi:hypothetical protein
METILLPDETYERAEELAAQDHVSVNRFAAAVLNEHLSNWSRVRDRAARGSVEELKRVLAKVKDFPVEAADQL